MLPVTQTPPEAQTYQVLLVDDDILLQELLEVYLRDHNFHIHSLPCGEKMGEFLQHQTPNLILLDIILPGKDGLYWLAWSKEHYPHIPVILLSAKKSADERLHGLESGADDYLTKPFHPKELIIRIQHIMRHTPLATSYRTYQIGDKLFDPIHERLECESSHIKLTTQENTLLHFLCQHSGQILTRDSISHAVTGHEHHPLNRSIDMTINRLRKKLGDNASTPRYLCTVWRKGYRLILE